MVELIALGAQHYKGKRYTSGQRFSAEEGDALDLIALQLAQLAPSAQEQQAAPSPEDTEGSDQHEKRKPRRRA